jgi:hypothetical protein
MLARRVVLKEKFLQRLTLSGRFLNTTQTHAEQIEKKEAERSWLCLFCQIIVINYFQRTSCSSM